MPSFSKIAGSVAALATAVSAADCDCYLTDGSSPAYFKNYGFWDFRDLSRYAGVPATINTVSGNANAGFTSDYFGWSSDFQKFWGPQNWDNGAEFTNVNSFNNLYISSNPNGDSATMLTMRTARGSNFQSSSEFETKAKVDHASMRMYARTHGDAGACTAIFTYLGADSLKDVQEADIEILTRDPETAIHYTNQPSYLEDGTTIDGASNNITMPGGKKWSDWMEHRMDWTPGMTTWSVDGQVLHAQSFQAPVDPAQILLNVWSDGNEWTGRMRENGQAFQDVQWIELAYDVTSKGSCSKVCSVDAGAPGSPIPI
ncbi:glycosyl hydrolases family 16 domain-containing protein [Sarocladium implicatum]|nr:glycosyl hydrolases family 16 domain-containing protein [Sarocladium implicatum]